MSRRQVILAALVAVSLAVAGVLLFALNGAPKAETVLRVGSQKGGVKSLLLASGVLEGAPYRVEWSEFPAAQPLLEALSANAVDLGAVGDAPFIFAYAGGSKIKAVQASRSSGGGRSTALLVRADSPIRTPVDLRGKSIATGRGSIGHYLVLRVLERAGLTPADVKIVYLSPSDSKAAFSTGAVDAWATWGPYVGAATLHDRARVLADGQGLLTGVGFQAATDKAVAAKRPELDDFLRRLAKAQAWANQNKAAYAKVLAKETGLPLDVAVYTVSQARSVPVPIDASVIDEERETLVHFVKAGVIAKAPAIEGAFDPSFNTSTEGHRHD